MCSALVITEINRYNNNVAEIAQSVEHFTRNEGVVGSSPIFSCLIHLQAVLLADFLKRNNTDLIMFVSKSLPEEWQEIVWRKESWKSTV